jgi:hypothetical protein
MRCVFWEHLTIGCLSSGFFIKICLSFAENDVEMFEKVKEIDWKFRNYVSKNYRRGDKLRLQNMLCLSFPTLQKHLTGMEVNPAIQAQVVEYFERRKRQESQAMNYVSKRLDQVDGEVVPVADVPSVNDMISMYEETEDGSGQQDQ